LKSPSEIGFRKPVKQHNRRTCPRFNVVLPNAVGVDRVVLNFGHNK
jgi:hypothetical protein